MGESHLLDRTVPGAATVPESTTNMSTTTSPIEACTQNRLGKNLVAVKLRHAQRRDQRTKKSSPELEGRTQPSSFESDVEAVPGAVPIPGSNSSPSFSSWDGSSELEDGNNYDVHDERSSSFLVVASQLVDNEDGGDVPVENLEQRIHQVVETQLLMHHQNIVIAEAVGHNKKTTPDNLRTTDDDRSHHNKGRLFFYKNWRWLLLLLLVLLVATVTLIVTNQNRTTPDPKPELMPTTSVVLPPSSPPTTTFREVLKPWIIRTDDDLDLLNDGTSPQWRALDWLSTDSIALSENGAPQIILQRYVLAVLFFATGGDDWLERLVPFLQPTSVCEWNNGVAWGDQNALGVYCATPSTVQQMRIRDFGLNGTLPWELSLLQTLVFLDLGDNPLTGTLPSELGNLLALDEFYLYGTGLTGKIPTDFGRLTSLRVFWPIRSSFTGPLPTEIGQMTDLESLLLHENAFSGTLPTELGLLTDLQILSLGANQFSGPLPSEMGQMMSLATAWIADSNFSGTLPTEFAQLSNLSTFTFQNSSLTGSVDDILCLSQQWYQLEADCASDTSNGTQEIQCSCCTSCCTPDGDICS